MRFTVTKKMSITPEELKGLIQHAILQRLRGAGLVEGEPEATVVLRAGLTDDGGTEVTGADVEIVYEESVLA